MIKISYIACLLGLVLAADDATYNEITESMQKMEQKFETEMKALHHKIEVQQAYISAKELDNQRLKADLESVKKLIDKQELSISLLRNITANNGEISGTNGSISHKRYLMSGQNAVAFQATIDGVNHVLTHVYSHQTIIFDTVKLNIGGGYHSHQGLFIAPQPGIYIFATAVKMRRLTNDPFLHVIMKKNGGEIAGAFAYDAGAGNYFQSSVTIVVELAVGDEVYVDVERHSDIEFYGDGLTSFMGCLVAQ